MEMEVDSDCSDSDGHGNDNNQEAIVIPITKRNDTAQHQQKDSELIMESKNVVCDKCSVSLKSMKCP